MPLTLTIPKLQMSMTEGTLVEWKVASGSQVEEGQAIYVLETDKSAIDIVAPAAGTLIHKANAGSSYEVGTEIGQIA